uniref:TLC domain-containing protein n=1 Tax=Spongospora subterranea TaxID=70186 RepID=A0A0H5RP14_9EUKA|eukprot:CRZ10454.1 hypothetical protein [Spongospora subterranea]
MEFGCAAGPGLVLSCVWIECLLSCLSYILMFIASDKVASVFYKNYMHFNSIDRSQFKSNIGSLINSIVSFIAIVHMVYADHITLASQDPVHFYPHLLSYYGPMTLGFYIFDFLVRLAYQIELSNRVEVVVTSSGKTAPNASLSPLITPFCHCFIIAYSLQTKLFGIYGVFTAVMSVQQIFYSATVLLRFRLQSASEKNLFFRVTNVLQYITFPILRWISGPYSAYLIYANLEEFLAFMSWPALAIYAYVIAHENLFTILFGLRAILFIVKPDFLQRPSNMD